MPRSINKVSFLKNGSVLVVATTNTGALELHRFDVSGTGPLRRFQTLKLPAAASAQLMQGALALDADGSRIATANAGAPPTITVWNTTTGLKMQTRILQPDGYINHLAFKGNSETLAFALTDPKQNKIILWDTRKSSSAGNQGVDPVDDTTLWLAWSPDGKTLASGHAGNNVILRQWDVNRAGFFNYQRLVGHHGAVSNIAFSLDGRTMASVSWDRSAILWDIAGGRSFGRRLGSQTARHTDSVFHIVFAPDGKTIRSSGADGREINWNLANPASSRTNTAPFTPGIKSQKLINLVCSADGRWRAWSRDDGTLVVQSSASGKLQTLPFKHPDDPGANSLAFNPRTNLLAAGGAGKDLIMWDVKSGSRQPLQKLEGHGAPVSSIAFSPDGKWMASADVSGTVLWWEVGKTHPVAWCTNQNKTRIRALAISHNAETVAIGSDDFIVSLWMPKEKTASAPQVLGTHKHWVTSLAFGRDKLLASGSADKTIIVWDIATRHPIAPPIKSHIGLVSGLAFSPDSQSLASASSDGSVRLWDINVQAWQKRARNIANRNLTVDEWSRYIGDDPPYPYPIPNLNPPFGK